MKKTLSIALSGIVAIAMAAGLGSTTTSALVNGESGSVTLSASSTTVNVGDAVTIDVTFESGLDQSAPVQIIGAEVTLNYNPNIFNAAASSVNKDFAFSVPGDAEVNSTTGEITFKQGSPQPGIASGTIGSVTLTAIADGETTVAVNDMSELTSTTEVGGTLIDVLGTTADAPITVGTSNGGGGEDDVTPPVVSDQASSDETASSVVISWITDEPTTGIVEYGTSVNLGSTKASTTLQTSHTVTITDLDASTEYLFRIVATDQSGNETTSPVETFTTAASGTSGSGGSGGSGGGSGGSGTTGSGTTGNGTTTSAPGGSSTTSTTGGEPILAPITGAGEWAAIIVAIVAGVLSVVVYMVYTRRHKKPDTQQQVPTQTPPQ